MGDLRPLALLSMGTGPALAGYGWRLVSDGRTLMYLDFDGYIPIASGRRGVTRPEYKIHCLPW